MTTPRPAREKILAAAGELFYANGMNATGIDTITHHAGVAKKSLYNNFDSKDALIVAYLTQRHADWCALYYARVATATIPQDRALAVFDAYIDHAQSAYPHGFRGCGLLNAAAELPADAPGRALVRQHKEEVEALLSDAIHDCGLSAGRAAVLAEHCAFLLEGAITRAGLEGSPHRLEHARSMAAAMLAQIA